VEASAVHHPAGLAHPSIAAPLLRLRSDEQLLALLRSGNDAAFDVLHDRYRQRLFAYVRQMLSGASRQDAEDVTQDVFFRAYGALRADTREMNVRAWLYRVAHNRCIDHLRRPVPPAAELYDVSRKPLHDPVEEAQRREDLSRLVEDIGRLPEQQRSALLMRELDGLSYADLADALDVTVPAVKSLLVRARVGLVDAAEARDAACDDIRTDLVGAYDRGVKASARARRHMRTCDGCRAYRDDLRGVRHGFAALAPAGFGPLAMGAKLLGLGGGGAGAGAAAGGGAAAAGGSAAGGVMATATACKVAAVVCTAALTAAGGAVEADQIASSHQRPHHRAAAHATAPIRVAAPARVPRAIAPVQLSTGAPAPVVAPQPTPAAEPPKLAEASPTPVDQAMDPALTGAASPDGAGTGSGTAAPPSGGTAEPTASPTPSPSTTPAGGTSTTGQPPAQPATGDGGTSTGGNQTTSPGQPAATGSGNPATPPTTP
jgi:RNA polymerase sigma factor (sigma-70 family)